MSNALERTDFDTNDTGLRDHIESSVANHSYGPDVDSVVGNALEQHSRDITARNDRELYKKETPPDGIRRQDRLRHSIRQAVAHAKQKAAQPETPKASFEVPAGPPQDWDKNAQAAWSSLPHEARQAILRSDKTKFDALEPHFRNYRELDAAIAPHRHVIPQGMSEPQAIGNVLAWAGALKGPNKTLAAAQLLNECGVSLPDLVALTYGQQPQYEQQYQQQYQQPDYAAMQREQQVHQTLSQFSQGKEHFEKVRYAMGLAIQNNGQRYMRADGDVDLDKAYRDCCRAAGLSDGHDRSRRTAAAVSPRGRAPAGRSESGSQSGSSVRQSINNAIMEARG